MSAFKFDNKTGKLTFKVVDAATFEVTGDFGEYFSLSRVGIMEAKSAVNELG